MGKGRADDASTESSDAELREAQGLWLTWVCTPSSQGHGTGGSSHPRTERPPSHGEEPLGLTSSSSQVAVEGNVSLAHGQEICTDIWNDRRARHETPATTALSSPGSIA